MKKIFLTAIGGDIGYGIIKALKNSSLDLFYIGCDIQKYNYSYDEVDKFYISPPYRDEKNWMEFILKVLRENEADYFWPVTEPEIKIVSKYIDQFSFCKVIINQDNILKIALDKGNTAKTLAEAGVKTPETYYSVETCDDTFPKIVKEKFGCGSHGVRKVDNKEELISAFNDMKDPIIQRCVGDSSEEFTMTIFSDGKIINNIAFQRTLGFGGMSRFVKLVHDPKLDEIAGKIAKVLNLQGSINVQMRKENEEYYVFEINPRISSTMGFRLKLGFNDAAWWLDMIEGKDIDQYIAPQKQVYGVRNVEEKLFYE